MHRDAAPSAVIHYINKQLTLSTAMGVIRLYIALHFSRSELSPGIRKLCGWGSLVHGNSLPYFIHRENGRDKLRLSKSIVSKGM